MWYTGFNSNTGAAEVARITTAGVVTPYALPDHWLSYTITAGPDGALWFTGTGVGRITTSGALTIYNLPTAGDFTEGITTGPDGALWFTVHQGKIGRITTGGAITVYPIPVTSNSAPYGIVTGPDGAVWYLDQGRNEVVRYTGGIFTSYPLGPDLFAWGMIAAGPDGGLWFGDNMNGEVARVPACGLGLRLSFNNTSIDMRFTLSTASPGTWYINLSAPGGQKTLDSMPVGTIAPPRVINTAYGPGFPALGSVGISSGVADSSGQAMCAEWGTVYTAQP